MEPEFERLRANEQVAMEEKWQVLPQPQNAAEQILVYIYKKKLRGNRVSPHVKLLNPIG
jgi:hypothetical protein